MKCFYHASDYDGKCSAAIVRKFNPECQLIPITYGRDFPWDRIWTNEIVYMVDFCLQPFDEMVKLAHSCKKLIWLDHHVSAMRAHSELEIATGFRIEGIRKTELAACEITWTYFSDDPIQKGIRLLGRYDVWDLGWDIAVMPFQYGLRAWNLDAYDSRWNMIFDNDIEMYEEVVEAGENIMMYVTSDYSRTMRSMGFEIEWEGYRCLCVNRGYVSSHIFENFYDPMRHDLMISFCMNQDKRWRVTIYTDKEIDCSRIATKYGGGGHAKAAGFVSDNLPFLEGKEQH